MLDTGLLCPRNVSHDRRGYRQHEDKIASGTRENCQSSRFAMRILHSWYCHVHVFPIENYTCTHDERHRSCISRFVFREFEVLYYRKFNSFFIKIMNVQKKSNIRKDKKKKSKNYYFCFDCKKIYVWILIFIYFYIELCVPLQFVAFMNY